MNDIIAAILGMYKIEPLMQICLRNLRIACSTDHVSNIPVRELNLNLKKETAIKKSVYHTIPGSGTHQGLPITQPYHFF
jgi:hypothetical protein